MTAFLAILVFHMSALPSAKTLFSSMDLGQLVLVVEEAKLVFAGIIYPLLLAGMLKRKASQDLFSRDAKYIFAAFMALSLPLTFLTFYYSFVITDSLIYSTVFIFLIAIVPFALSVESTLAPVPEGTLGTRGGEKYKKCLVFYFFGFFLISAVLPVVFYLILEIYQCPVDLLIRINPFWFVWNASGDKNFWPYFIWLAAIAGILIVRRMHKRTIQI